MTAKRRMRLAALLLGGAALMALPALAQDAGKAPPATVNGEAITDQDLAIAAEDIGASLPQQMTPEQKRDYLTSYAVDLKLVAAEGEKQKLLDEADLARRLDYFRRKILMEKVLAKAAADASTETALRKLYDETVKTVKPEEEVHARHILLESEDEAKKAQARVNGGEDFAKVAKELSKDPGSADGGDLGFFTKDRMVKEFADAAFALKPGEVSVPVKSQFGWHVIKVEDKRSKPAPAFEAVKDQVATYVTRKALAEFVTKLREGAKIERLDKPAEEKK
jgi:peptidyl-prolyl cis-trans isomerase C